MERCFMKKVVKFGGSSLASAEQFMKVGAIIRADESRRYVVPSAPGKRFSDDTKVTDMLYHCYELAEQSKAFNKQLNQIKDRYNEIIYGLKLDLSLDEDFEIIKKQFVAKAGSMYAASRGEYLNGKIMAKYLGYEFVDAANVIRFNKDGSFDSETTNELLATYLDKIERAVIPGFYGAMKNGTVVTFSRGGSDITGSIVSKAVMADIYENWTDVSGFLVTDPRIVHNPEPIEAITYRELRELSYMGASVLHEDAIFPVRQAGIPINIKNTNSPEDKGTMIVEKTCHVPKYTITGIAGKKDFVAINIEKDMMNAEIGFGRKVLEAFEKYGISFEHMPSGVDTMTVIVHQSEFEEKEQKVLTEIARVYNEAMNIIHYMHDKYYYEKAQMALVDTNPRINLAYGVAGLSIALDSLSAIKYAKVTARRNDIGLTEGFDIQGEFPCFGNDNDKVDHLGVDLVYFFSEELKKLPVYKNARPTLSLLTITSNVMYGKKTGATPDGRAKGVAFAPGANPMHGRDKNGAIASLSSVAKLRYRDSQDGISNTFSIVPKSLGATEEDRVENLVTMMDGYFTKGAHHLNVNVLNREMLYDAMEHPEKYPQLTIRVSGYAVNFVKLSREHQLEVISRSFHERM